MDPLIANLRRFVPEQPPAPAGEAGPEAVAGRPPTWGVFEIAAASTLPEGQSPVVVGADADWPRAFGKYELLEKIAQGGMGIVYKARQLPPLERLVALKVIAAGAASGPGLVARFRVEAQAVARLKHPHIVQIYDYGEQDGQPYFSMELMEGGSLKQQLAGQPQPERAAAELVRTLALAVQAAHRERVVHRDLKPGNVLLDKTGVAKIADFGLAKLLDDDQGSSLPEAIVGTPSYMAPEQARGDAGAVGPLVDVYALGAILYEMLTGRPPFLAAHRQATMDQVCSEPPEPIAPQRPRVPLDLEAICLKCLEKDPGRRYASAQALADDLGRWQRGVSTVARPLSWPQWAWRKLWRNAALSSAAAAVLLVSVVALAVVVYSDPERTIQHLEGQLARGKAVQLLPDTNGPRWFRLRTGESSAKIRRSNQGSFTISAFEPVLCELIRDPRQDRYRFRAEVQLASADPTGVAGIYFAHQATPLATTDLHEFMDLTFNDIMDAKDDWRSLCAVIPPPYPPEPQANQVNFRSKLYAERLDKPIATNFDVARPEICPSRRGRTPGKWFSLVVEVTPDTVSASWDGQQVGSVAIAKITGHTKNCLASLRKDHPDELVARQEGPCLNFRGGLGLYVSRSSANFRDVAVEPMEIGK
jgi:serine/threonine-protein kinase